MKLRDFLEAAGVAIAAVAMPPAYAKQVHTENLRGGWIDEEKGFKGHKFR